MSRAATAITTPVTNAAKQPGQPRLVPVDKNVLREIITRHIVSIRLVNCCNIASSYGVDVAEVVRMAR